MANSVPILDRLVGLETEYAIRFRPREGVTESPARFHLYQALITRLKRHVLTAPARHFKEGVFLANGGAVWFETERPAAGGGLIEGATPECRGPLQVVRYQRAQDQLLSQCARLAEVDGVFSLVKNDRDGLGHVYGAQENYEAILGTAWSLWIWRVGLILLAPLVMLTWLGVGLMIVGILVYLALAGLIYLPVQWFAAQPRRVAMVLFGRDLVEGRETGGPTPVWLETALLWFTRLVHAPLAACLLALIALTVFRRTRGQLVPFLVSRCIVAGAGMVDDEGDVSGGGQGPGDQLPARVGRFPERSPGVHVRAFLQGHVCRALAVAAGLLSLAAAAPAIADWAGRFEHGRDGGISTRGHDGAGLGRD